MEERAIEAVLGRHPDGLESLPPEMHLYEAQRMGWITETFNYSVTSTGFSELEPLITRLKERFQTEDGRRTLLNLVKDAFREGRRVSQPEFLTRVADELSRADGPLSASGIPGEIDLVASDFSVSPEAVSVAIAVFVKVAAIRDWRWISPVGDDDVQLVT